MAWLEKKGEAFRIRFRYGGSKHLCALHTSDQTEAEDSLAGFEANLRLVDRGIIDPPPENVDLGVYILSGGKLTTRPAGVVPAERATLKTLLDNYQASFPKAAKEANTWHTEEIYIGHFRRLLDVNLPLAEVTQKTIQGYVNARTREKGQRKRLVSRATVQKELGIFSSSWNNVGRSPGLINTPPPVTGLTFPKGVSKPPLCLRRERRSSRGLRTGSFVTDYSLGSRFSIWCEVLRDRSVIQRQEPHRVAQPLFGSSIC